MISHPPVMARTPELLSSSITLPNDVWGADSSALKNLRGEPFLVDKDSTKTTRHADSSSTSAPNSLAGRRSEKTLPPPARRA